MTMIGFLACSTILDAFSKAGFPDEISISSPDPFPFHPFPFPKEAWHHLPFLKEASPEAWQRLPFPKDAPP